MITSLFHWLNVEYWTASWPNVFAPSFWTLLGIGVAHRHLVIRQDRHHAVQMAAIKKNRAAIEDSK